MTNSDWNLKGWRSRPALQQPEYEDPSEVERCVERLRNKPPLVAQGEVEHLRSILTGACEGKRFVLHGGDCAERFTDCTGPSLTAKLQVLLQMSLVLTFATRRPVIRIGRFAGQYAKPRSEEHEQVGDLRLPVYRGSLVNAHQADPEARRPDPERMIDGYHHSAASLNYIRALIEGGFADLHHPERWDLAFIESSPYQDAYRHAVDAITDAIALMETVGASTSADSLRRIEFYTSHEALLLPYEEGLTRVLQGDAVYNLGAHFLWLGYRTSAPDGAHVEYLRGIRNPLGIKVGPKSDEQDLLDVLRILDPNREPGRITLITRFGERDVASHLPRIIRAIGQSGHPVIWSCDPMHGNTETATDGRKTRRVDAIFSELEQSFEIHSKMGTCLGGVHFELTGEPVTECIGGSGGVTESDLAQCYSTACDPRLNGAQALEMAFLIARLLR
ncbi:MAG TPA: 3-deoxy-7-phosphoheptulonate synthase class II [bacterium]|nr:3-deoxy-7-phosphoheptulonate synthase class II [bacterium]